MVEIHRSTPGAGRRLALTAAIMAIVGAAIVALADVAQPRLVRWAAGDPARTRERVRLLGLAIAVVVLAPLAGFSIYVWRLGSRVLREERFPPEGLAMVRDTVVLRGPRARARGHVLRVMAVVLVACASVMLLLLWRLAALVR